MLIRIKINILDTQAQVNNLFSTQKRSDQKLYKKTRTKFNSHTPNIETSQQLCYQKHKVKITKKEGKH